MPEGKRCFILKLRRRELVTPIRKDLFMPPQTKEGVTAGGFSEHGRSIWSRPYWNNAGIHTCARVHMYARACMPRMLLARKLQRTPKKKVRSSLDSYGVVSTPIQKMCKRIAFQSVAGSSEWESAQCYAQGCPSNKGAARSFSYNLILA